jgi:hypothetical protein
MDLNGHLKNHLHEQFLIFSRNERYKALHRDMNATAEEAMSNGIGATTFEFSNDPTTIYHIKNWLKAMRIQRKFWLLVALVNRFHIQHHFRGESRTEPNEEALSLYRRWRNDGLKEARAYKDGMDYYKNRLKEFGHSPTDIPDTDASDDEEI